MVDVALDVNDEAELRREGLCEQAERRSENQSMAVGWMSTCMKSGERPYGTVCDKGSLGAGNTSAAARSRSYEALTISPLTTGIVSRAIDAA